MSQTSQLWVLGSLVTVMSGLLAYIAKLITQQVLKRLDAIVVELQRLNNASIIHEERLNTLRDAQAVQATKQGDHSNLLADHEHRITRLEVTSQN